MPALRAARAVADAVQELGLDVRIGLHAGDVEVSGKQVSGMIVHIGARVMSLAGPAQILVTSTLRDIEAGPTSCSPSHENTCSMASRRPGTRSRSPRCRPRRPRPRWTRHKLSSGVAPRRRNRRFPSKASFGIGRSQLGCRS